MAKGHSNLILKHSHISFKKLGSQIHTFRSEYPLIILKVDLNLVLITYKNDFICMSMTFIGPAPPQRQITACEVKLRSSFNKC